MHLFREVRDVFRLAERNTERLQICFAIAQNVFGIDRAEGVLHARPNGCLRLCGNLLPHDVVYHGGKKVVVHGALNVPHAVDDRRELLVLFP